MERSDMSAPAIETKQLTKYYGKSRGIIDLDLRVETGEVFGFLGPNGAGKTTTIRLLMDLIHPTSGRASIFEKDAHEETVAIKALTGYLPGELALWNNLTGRQILTFLGNLRGGVKQGVIEELARRLEIDLDKKFREYSKGNKQKVGLAQAFMHRPRLLILDEPTSGLDPLNQQEFFRMLSEANAGGATVFLSSHVLSEVESTCNRVGIIREGRLVRVGSVREVVAEKLYHIMLSLGVPASDEMVQAFAALPSVSEVKASDHTLQFIVQGDVDPVVKKAANYPVLTMTSHEPTLEEAFLTYYRGSGDGDRGSGTESAASGVRPPTG
jgi:ABC-2 type transport system ATP-binding protein